MTTEALEAERIANRFGLAYLSREGFERLARSLASAKSVPQSSQRSAAVSVARWRYKNLPRRMASLVPARPIGSPSLRFRPMLRLPGAQPLSHGGHVGLIR